MSDEETQESTQEDEVQEDVAQDDVQEDSNDEVLDEATNGFDAKEDALLDADDSDELADDDEPEVFTKDDRSTITHPDTVGDTPESDGDTFKGTQTRGDFVELAVNQYILTPAEAEELFDRTGGTFDDDVVADIKSNRKVVNQIDVTTPAGDVNPLNVAEANKGN